MTLHIMGIVLYYLCIGMCKFYYLNQRKFILNSIILYLYYRACRGKHITVIVRLTNANRSLVDDHELVMHSNDNISCVRRQLFKRLRNSGTITAITGTLNIKLDIFPGTSIDLISTLDDNKLLGELPFRDKLVILLTYKLNIFIIANSKFVFSILMLD